MANRDAINYLQEIRGTKAVGESPLPTEDDGMYHDMARKTTEDDGVTPRLGNGIYGSIKEMYSGITPIIDIADEIVAVVSDIGSVTTVATNIADVVTVAAIEAEVVSLASSKAAIDSLYLDKATLDSLFSDKATLDSLFADKATIDSLFADKATLDSLYADKLTLDSLLNDKATLDSIYADKTKLDSLYADKVKLDALYADKTTLDRLHTSIAEIDRLFASADNIDTVAASANNVDIVATNIGDVNTVAADIAKVIKVADDLNEAISEVETVANDLNETTSEIEVVAASIANVDSLGPISAELASLESVKAEILSLESIKIKLDSLYADKITLDSLFADKAAIDSVYADKITLDSIYADKTKLDSLFSDKATLDSLFADKAALDSIYADKLALDSLYADKTTIDRIYASIANIDRLFTSIANIDSVHGSIGNVDSVAGNAANINSVAITVVPNIAEILLADDNAATATSAKDIAVAAKDDAEAANSSAQAALTATANILDTFDDRMLGALAVEPTLDNDGDALVAGTIYYDTVLETVRFYNGTTWESPDTAAAQSAQNASDSAAAALVSEGLANDDAIATAADRVQTGLDRVATGNDVAATNADVAQTTLDRAAVAADLVATNQDTLDTAADVVTTGNNVIAAQTAQGIAQTAQTGAETALNEVEKLYLGAKASDPATDNDGGVLQVGAWYYNTTEVPKQIKIWNGTTFAAAVFDASGAVIEFNGRDGIVTLLTSDIEAALGVTPLTLASLQFTGGTGNQGLVTWNTDEETLDLDLGDAVLQLGQETHIHCRNTSGSQINNGTVVMATGTLGASGRITVAPYDGTSDVKFILGVTTSDLANDTDGKVTTFGKVRGIDTSSFLEGDVLYATTGGGFTKVEPTSGVHAPMAMVINVHAVNGTIMVRFTPLDTNLYEPADATIVKDASYVHTDNNYTSTEKTKLSTIEAGATADQTKADIDGLGIDAETLDDLNSTQFLRSDQDDTTTGQLTINRNAPNPLVLTRSSQVGIEFDDTSVAPRYLGVNAGNLRYGTNIDHSLNHLVYHSANLSKAVIDALNVDAATAVSATSATTATKLATARTIDITGDITATAVAFDGTGNIAISASVNDDSHNHVTGNIDGLAEYISDTVGGMVSSNTETGLSVTYDDTDNTLDFALTNDPVITLAGDLSGSVTLTNLGSGTLTATVADDSHNHIISNVDGLQNALDGKVDDSQVLTNVPAGAVFTDTTYSVQDGELSEISFTSADNTKLDFISATQAIDLDKLSRLDKVIANETITNMTYTGGSSGDKLDSITYTNNYSEIFSYNGTDKLQFIDHRISGVNQSYTELVYTGTQLTSTPYTASARV